jgi:hypothetical protein
MRDYENSSFIKIIEQVSQKEKSVIDIKEIDGDLIFLKLFLTKRQYYAVIIDDYPFEIFDKKSLLEALYYQIRLITVHDLNWDAIHEGLGDALSNFFEFEGICLLFKSINSIPDDFNTLIEIVNDVNKINSRKITILLK